MSERVDAVITGRFVEPVSYYGVPLTTSFHFAPEEPLAVTVIFGEGIDASEWLVGRDLLRDAFSARAGVGDISAWTVSGRYCIRLQNGDGSYAAVLAFSAAEISDFLARTFQAVPPGTEVTEDDIDRELSLYFS